jgi:2-polyprenyl-3-methyl-5-hydroxy-6-metoxy-1,4-benzoquinol methylase
MSHDTTSQAFFEAKYQTDPDPWNFATSEYERGRYAAILDALPKRNYAHAFEPGCSIGVLTKQLAPMCDKVDAMDISPTAVATAQQCCAAFNNVIVTCGALPSDLPTGPFDLVVFSEIGYYFDESQLLLVLRAVTASMTPNAIFLAAHWLGSSRDHILSGDRVHEIIQSIETLKHDHSERNAGFRLDRWIHR